ncbi:MAG: serine hydrolase [Planctomycetota bacterium]
MHSCSTKFLWSAFFSFLLAATPARAFCADETPADTNDKIAHFLDVAEQLRRRLNVPGIGIGIVTRNEVVYTGGVGYRNIAKQEPVTEDTLFAIGSNTKAFTGLLVTQLVTEEKLSWDRPIASYVPGFRLSDEYVTEHVTLADACSHMTGLARQDALWKGKDLTRQQVYDQVQDLPFEHSLRKEFLYNNHMYVVVGKAIESVTELSWEDNVRNRIFQPLGMNDSYVTYKEFMVHSQKSIGYGPDGITPLPHVNVDGVAPAGSISSTPKDFAKWLLLWVDEQSEFRPTVLPEEGYQRYTMPRSASMRTPGEFMSYWAGWGEKFGDDQLELRHSGGIDGQNSIIHVSPKEGFGVFVLMNQNSDCKDLLVDYAKNIFLRNDFTRDVERERQLASIQDFIDFQRALLDDGIPEAKEHHRSVALNDLEPQMNALGYALLAQQDFEKALFVFQTNCEDHPGSSNAHDSLGECHFTMKQYKQAAKHYQESFDLDPSNTNASKMLAQIELLMKE